MPNYCDYSMKIRGSKEHCEEWLKKMTSYEEDNHFFRIFDATVGETAEPNEYEDNPENYWMVINGYCAWSIESCCRASGYSDGIDLLSVNTKDLHLVMEVYSSEPGVGFQEHYIYANGHCIESECVQYMEWYWSKDSETYDEFAEGLENPPPEEDFDEDGYCKIGGFEWDFEIPTEETDEYMTYEDKNQEENNVCDDEQQCELTQADNKKFDDFIGKYTNQ